MKLFLCEHFNWTCFIYSLNANDLTCVWWDHLTCTHAKKLELLNAIGVELFINFSLNDVIFLARNAVFITKEILAVYFPKLMITTICDRGRLSSYEKELNILLCRLCPHLIGHSKQLQSFFVNFYTFINIDFFLLSCHKTLIYKMCCFCWTGALEFHAATFGSFIHRTSHVLYHAHFDNIDNKAVP